MIKPLRKRHLQVWSALAIFLPVGIIASWRVIPKPVFDHLLQPASTRALPLVLHSVERGNYTVLLRTNPDSSELQLEWINKSALTAPSAIIYQVASEKDENNLTEGGLIGRIDSRGDYYFPLKNNSIPSRPYFILYDIIHHRVIDRIKFQP